MEIKNCIAVVTGSGSGFGRDIALTLSREGADLVLADIDTDRMEAVCQEIQALGRRAITVQTDVTQLDSIQHLYDKALEEMGRIDILVNNAGVYMMGPFDGVTIDDWEWIINTNLWSVIYGIQVFLPHFLSRGSGYIVNTASISGYMAPLEPSIPYATTKNAVVGLSEGLAVFLRNKGIGISVVCPGIVATNIGSGARIINPDPEKARLIEKLLGSFKEQQAESPEDVVTSEDVANMTIQAIKDNSFRVVTHPGSQDIMVERIQNIEKMIDDVAAERATNEGRMNAFLDDIRKKEAEEKKGELN
jgi:NAD(P)-dependent dehydrogenase (short-subunit alcohol dehydrogenase family)